MINFQSGKSGRPVDILHTHFGHDGLVLNHGHENINKHK